MIGQLDPELDLLAKGPGQQFGHSGHQLIGIEKARGEGLAAAEGKQALGQFGGAASTLAGMSKGACKPFGITGPARSQVEIADDHRKHVVEVMGNSAGELPDRFGVTEEPQLVRDALAGEDDAEDAQWLVVVEDPAARLDSAALDAFAAEYEGWLEVP